MPTSGKFFLFLQTILFIFLSKSVAISQTEFSQKTLSVEKNQRYSLQLEKPITALAIRLNSSADFQATYIQSETEKFLLQLNEDFTESSLSQLIIFQNPIKQFTFFSGEIEGNISFQMQFVEPFSGNLPLRIRADSCGKPMVVPASEWRKGLTPPKEAPVQTKVNFIIIHHAAGSNTATNYADVVRNIYTFHTAAPPNGNGWNDVGYNFLIAQDGTVFEGRSGQGNLENDNVLGAHFCGKNSQTMGICLLGNYMDVEPTKQTLQSLVQLIGWKLNKEKLTNIGQGLHTGGLLNIISGHRDGCSTDCPGNFVYQKFEEIRNAVGRSCAFTGRILQIENTDNQAVKVFPNPTFDYLIIENYVPTATIEIVDYLGKKMPSSIEKLDNQSAKIDVRNLSEGVYFLRYQHKTIKFVVSN